jgi:hypothetical protein
MSTAAPAKAVPPSHESTADERRLDEITEKIIGCAFTVSNTLGAGFMEKVYENALALEIRAAGLPVIQQHPIAVWYKGVIVGEFVADRGKRGSRRTQGDQGA